MSSTSRAEYYRERRKQYKQLVFLVDKEKAELLDKKLVGQKISRIDWFRSVLDKELSQK